MEIELNRRNVAAFLLALPILGIAGYFIGRLLAHGSLTFLA